MDIRGLIVLVITAGIMALLIIGIVGAAFWGKTLTGAAVESLSTVLGMLIGVVSSYVAGALNNGRLPGFLGETAPPADKPVEVPPPRPQDEEP